MGNPPHGLLLKFSMPSDPRYLPVVRGAIGPLAALIGWDESECDAIVLAIHEALANVITHAYHNRTDGLMELECRESADGLEIALLDNGDAPDRSKICARENGRRATGRPWNAHHPERDGRSFLPGIAGGKSFCGEQAVQEGAMKITVREVGAAKVVEVDGDVDLGTSSELRRTLLPALPTGGRLALNLAAIRYIDSSGIATLIEVLKRSQNLKKEFVLFGLTPRVQEVFRLTHVIRIFQVFQTEQEALGVS